jgi:DNA-binding NarL/FixJ family response regulator
MAAQSLVLCRDPDVLRTLCPLLFEMNMGVEICLGSNGASRMVRKRKFDAIIVECDKDGGGLAVLQQLRADSPNQSTITVGVVDDYKVMKEAFATGANFVLSKPISAEDATRILRFAKGMISRMVRRFLRVAVHHLAHVDISSMKDPAFILDLSEGGIAIQSLAPMQHGQIVEISFDLPGTSHKIKATAKIVWNDPTGRIGMEFEDITDQQRSRLKTWVEERVKSSPEEFPANSMELPARVRVLSRWMRPLAVAIDGAFVSAAAAIFCLVAFLFLRGEAIFPLGVTFALAIVIGSIMYASLFWLLDVRFPGTRAVETLLASTSDRQLA